ncbi:hypothetical protein B0A50_03884 [Salinomyces thailandicus]|uniref:Uncharacterized protein n=1 Tax=Salinomyces thailandicus TaxID=706561 RepID=A0A4U0U0W3_9PEZI|nr:hypothetical protein B0A50_03884 [Salinomyces thailandica]
MPSRKSDSSDSHPHSHADSRHTSLRRLSSIASLQVLNPFARRRSNQASNSTAASSNSNLSLPSSTNNLSSSTNNTPISHQSQAIPTKKEELTALPVAVPGPAPPSQVPSHNASRRNSYVCLPDDPIGGMPRSRTFSNLPLPTKSRRQASIANSKSHSRLPSTMVPSALLPASMQASPRIPSPPASNHRHSNTRLPSVEPKPGLMRNRMKRSDTEPLLPATLEPTSIGRHTAFKENITLSPVRTLPPMTMEYKDPYRSRLPSRAYASRHGWQGNTDGTEPLLPRRTFASSLPLAHNRQRSLAGLSQSSPAYRSSRERQPTPGGPVPQPVQRWNSQPVLSNVTNRRNSKYGEIPERRLMAEVQPIPPPPPPKTPLSAEALTMGKITSTNDIAPRSLHTAKPTPSVATNPSSPSPYPGPLASSSLPPPYTHITTPEAPAYWSGRFSALQDRYRNAELAAHLSSPKETKPKASSDQMHTPEANIRRMRRALEELYSLCATSEAREGFVVFQLQLASLQAGETAAGELGRPVVGGSVPEKRIILGVGQERETEHDVVGGVGERRERTFMDRLLGRGRKSLV